MAGLPLLDASLLETPELESAVESDSSDPPVLLVTMSSRKGKDLRGMMLESDSACCKMPSAAGWKMHAEDNYFRQCSASTADTSYSRQYSGESDSNWSSFMSMPNAKDDLKALTAQVPTPPFPLEEWDLLEEWIGEEVQVSDAVIPDQDEEPLRTILDYATHLYKQKHGSDMLVAHGTVMKLQSPNDCEADTSPARSSNSSRKELDRLHTFGRYPEHGQVNADKPRVQRFRPRPSAIEIPLTPRELRRRHRQEVILAGNTGSRHRWKACVDSCAVQ